MQVLGGMTKTLYHCFFQNYTKKYKIVSQYMTVYIFFMHDRVSLQVPPDMVSH